LVLAVQVQVPYRSTYVVLGTGRTVQALSTCTIKNSVFSTVQVRRTILSYCFANTVVDIVIVTTVRTGYYKYRTIPVGLYLCFTRTKYSRECSTVQARWTVLVLRSSCSTSTTVLYELLTGTIKSSVGLYVQVVGCTTAPYVQVWYSYSLLERVLYLYRKYTYSS
jgi:hypothetical protein